MKKLIIIFCASALIFSCGDQSNNSASEENTAAKNEATEKEHSDDKQGNPSYDPNRGEGKFTNVEVGSALDAAMAESGQKVYSVKCVSCHKLTDEKLVGPGWKGVTSRHTAEWIMNFSTNPDVMIDKDPKAQAMLELCLVRMPNQNLSDDDARHVYEYMRKNDGVK